MKFPSLGMNTMEFDIAVRHRPPILVVISLNGGWTVDLKRDNARAQTAPFTVYST